MPDTTTKFTESTKKLLLITLIVWGLSIFFIMVGVGYLTYTTLALGIFHLFFGCLFILIIVQKISSAKSISSTLYEDKDDSDLFEHEDLETTDGSCVSDEEQILELESNMEDQDKFKSNGDIFYLLYLIIFSLGAIAFQVTLLSRFSFIEELITPPIWVGIIQIILSFTYLILVYWLFSKSTEYKMFGYVCKAGQIISFITGISVIIRALGYNQLEYILLIITTVACISVFIDFLIACNYRIKNKDTEKLYNIKLYILSAIFNISNSDTSLIDRIEEKIGVSFRSAWIIKFIRKILPIIVIIVVFVFWGMTALVEVGPQSEGIVYRLGKVESEQPLVPGLHVKLPWPIDQVKTYPVYKTQYFTVGYQTGENDNYLWTSTHGGEEYKLLLGNGKELVSINMTVHYRINDLVNYVMYYSEPEEVLQAKAYEKMLKLIVASDLDSLLSKDRSSLANTLKSQIQEASNQEKCGVEITDVAITSIHPPTEIATSYQELVSAGIEKEIIISEALRQYENAIPMAEKERDELIRDAMIDSELRHGEAVSEATQTIADKEAYEYNPTAYKTRKWLEAITTQLQSKRFYIIDKNIIDGDGRIWMDSFIY